MKCDLKNFICLFIGLITIESYASVNGFPNKTKDKNEIVEVSTLKIITLRPEDVNLPPVMAEPTKAPTLRRLDDVDQSDSPMYMIKSLEGYRPRMRRQRKKDHEKNQEKNAEINKENTLEKAQDRVEEKIEMKIQEKMPQKNRNGNKIKQEDGIIVPVMVVQMAQPPQPRPRNPRKPPKKQ